jgi:uncharacterized protein (DUF2225 family)
MVMDMEDTIFSELHAFGLQGAGGAKVYGGNGSGDGAEKPEGSGGGEQGDAQAHIKRSIYMKKFACPVCGKEMQAPAVKSSGVRLIRKDTDFMPCYKEPNPLYYFAVFCRHCGFAAPPANIKNMTQRQKALIREKISASWKFEKEYPAVYTPEIAIEIHKLALYNAVVSEDRESLRAIISLHIGWLYRIAGDSASEKMFLATALEGFTRAYENERGSVGGMDRASQQYLIGELMRRTGNLFGALKWFKMAMLDRSARLATKEMARDQKDLIMGIYEASKRHADPGGADPGGAAHGSATHRSATHGTAAHGSETRGSATHGNATHGTATHDGAMHGSATHGSAAHGGSAPGAAGHGGAGRQGAAARRAAKREAKNAAKQAAKQKGAEPK